MKNFNSHAHVERDRHRFFDHFRYTISTHTLTWSVTLASVGQFDVVQNFNSHAHVERDNLMTALDVDLSNFNSHAHVERDRTKCQYFLAYFHFNSHAHVERDACHSWQGNN